MVSSYFQLNSVEIEIIPYLESITISSHQYHPSRSRGSEVLLAQGRALLPGWICGDVLWLVLLWSQLGIQSWSGGMVSSSPQTAMFLVALSQAVALNVCPKCLNGNSWGANWQQVASNPKPRIAIWDAFNISLKQLVFICLSIVLNYLPVGHCTAFYCCSLLFCILRSLSKE